MPRMIELIKQSAVPAAVMRSAARGALSLPPEEMIEILVFLSHNPMFGDQARLALAGFDRKAMQQVAADPVTAPEVLEYLTSPANVRPDLLPVLLENASVPEQRLLELAESPAPDVLHALIASHRVWNNLAALETLAENADAPTEVREQATAALALLRPTTVVADGTTAEGDVLAIEAEINKFVADHEAEIKAEEAKTFELTELTEDEKRELHAKPAGESQEEQKRMSPLQRIAKMTVGERVQLAMKGNREDRYILIRDGSKVVSAAVLESPKLTDQEIETFAAMKNVQESVLRGIAQKRKFMKLYPVVRALTANPRCPLDVALPLMKNLLVIDLKYLSMNKNVSDTLRKVAMKMFKEKSSSKKSD